jgi:hypothetical protein
VDQFISSYSQNWRVVWNFHSPKSENNWSKTQKGFVKGKKTLARLVSGFVFLLANPEFYSHLASW